MASTQDFLPVDQIRDDLVILKDGSMAVVLQTSAVNFDLLSENERLAIIGTFAAMLNSLSFSIQILIRSKRLDISNYINILKEAEGQQKNPLLQLMMQHYRQFVNQIIRENEVLDKQFYVIISLSYLEVGMVRNIDKNFQKALTLLSPRVDHILRQLGRIGLKSTQLSTEKLIKLFYDNYNDFYKPSFGTLDGMVKQENQKVIAAQPVTPPPAPTVAPQPVIPVQSQPKPLGNYQSRPQASPFVVEELPDDYASV